jgi:hypothetical protein
VLALLLRVDLGVADIVHDGDDGEEMVVVKTKNRRVSVDNESTGVYMRVRYHVEWDTC